jgi:hypothetical protein
MLVDHLKSLFNHPDKLLSTVLGLVAIHSSPCRIWRHILPVLKEVYHTTSFLKLLQGEGTFDDHAVFMSLNNQNK